jgi:hypothetical protein
MSRTIKIDEDILEPTDCSGCSKDDHDVSILPEQILSLFARGLLIRAFIFEWLFRFPIFVQHYFSVGLARRRGKTCAKA